MIQQTETTRPDLEQTVQRPPVTADDPQLVIERRSELFGDRAVLVAFAFLTVSQAAKTIYRAISSGELQAETIPNSKPSHVIHRDDFAAWRTARRIDAEEDARCLSLNQAAEETGISYHRLLRMITSGQLPAGRAPIGPGPGGPYRIRPEDLARVTGKPVAAAPAVREKEEGDPRPGFCRRCSVRVFVNERAFAEAGEAYENARFEDFRERPGKLCPDCYGQHGCK